MTTTTNTTADAPRRFLTVPAPYVSRTFLTRPIEIPNGFRAGFTEADFVESITANWPRLIESEKRILIDERRRWRAIRKDLETPQGRAIAEMMQRVMRQEFGRTPNKKTP